jgi:hypothetical protein
MVRVLGFDRQMSWPATVALFWATFVATALIIGAYPWKH